MIAKATQDHPKNWHEYIPMLLFAYRATVQDSTGYSPFELMYGANPRDPLSLFKEKLLQEKKNKKNKVTERDSFEVVTKIRERIVYGLQNAMENAEREASRQRKIKNKNRYLRELAEQDLVFVWLPNWKGEKKWHGPFEIV